MWLQQSFQGRHQSRLLILARFPPTAQPPLPIRWKRIGVVELRDPVADRSIGNACGDGDRGDSASAQRNCFTSGPTSPSSLIQVLSNVSKHLSNPFDDMCIRHASIMTAFRDRCYPTFGNLLFPDALRPRWNRRACGPRASNECSSAELDERRETAIAARRWSRSTISCPRS
jgi:hypothetical protein